MHTTVHTVHDIPVDHSMLRLLSMGTGGRMWWALQDAITDKNDAVIISLAWEGDFLVGWGIRHRYHQASAPFYTIPNAETYSGEAWTMDVFITEDYRRKGYGSLIVADLTADGEETLSWPHDEPSMGFFDEISNAIDAVVLHAVNYHQESAWI